MHYTQRIIMVLAVCTVLLPMSGGLAFVSFQEKEEAKEELKHMIDDAVTHYRQRSGVQGQLGKNELVKADQEKKIASLMRQKNDVRKTISKQKRIIKIVGDRYGRELESKDQVQELIVKQKSRIARMLRTEYARRTREEESARTAIIDVLMQNAGAVGHESTVENVQMDVLQDLVAAEKAFWRLEVAQAKHEELLKAYWEAERSYEKTLATIERTEAQLAEIRQITAEVHDQVLKLQLKLSQIDEQLRKKAEQALIDKGLLDSSIMGESNGNFRPIFTWPVFGRVSAGFHNESYKKYFGVPHDGLDIVVGQGSPVAAAADGVVFFVRDGGATGYTYILIGHRSGYATLYGHLSETTVVAGQDVSAGDIIGLSGGQPGTRGAGPMTTGSHLHFEVIQAGVNLDPKTVLP